MHAWPLIKLPRGRKPTPGTRHPQNAIVTRIATLKRDAPAKDHPEENGTEVDADTKGSRIRRVMVSEELYPISELRGEYFLGALFEIQQSLEIRGSSHLSQSFGLYVSQRRRRGRHWRAKRLDLAVDVHSEPQQRSLERTGTVSYMALDLLKHRQCRIQHLYLHAHGTTIWVATWVFLYYKNGIWLCGEQAVTGSVIVKSRRKSGEGSGLSYHGYLGTCSVGCRNVTELFEREEMAVAKGEPYQDIVETDDPDDVLRAQWVTIERVAKRAPQRLGYALRYKPDFQEERSTVQVGDSLVALSDAG
ncbi:hypothetical protein K474DRAFT_1702145 [Panus rudis PR-1116 ss-1]|nr:hypothetical protein K474DRAFT_1702145 [Panus rudis PR-1116 ss-1]